MISGHGTTTKNNLTSNLDDWIYGDQNARDFKILWLHERELTETDEILKDCFESMGLDKDTLKEYSPREDETYLSAHNRVLDDLFLDNELADKGNRTKAYVSIYDPSLDLEAITRAKELSGDEYVTLNIVGFVDYFEGYESPETKAERERIEAEQKAAQPRTAPKKRAVASKVPKPLKAAEKALVEPSRPILEPLEDIKVNEFDISDKNREWAPLANPERTVVTQAISANLSTEVILPQESPYSPIEAIGQRIIDMGNLLVKMIEDFKAMLDDDKV